MGVVEARFLGGGLDLVGRDEVGVGTGGHPDLGRHICADPRVVLTLEMNVLVRPIRTMAPMSATPSDEPSCCPVYWRPPASLRPDSSTDDWTTLPSWETIKPIPIPSTPIPMAKPGSRGWA